MDFSLGPAQAFTLFFAHIHLSMTIWKRCLIWLDVICTAVGNSDWPQRVVGCSLLACNCISSGNNQITKAAWKSRVRFSQKIYFSHGWQANTTKKKAQRKILGAQSCETTMARQGSTCKQNGTRRWGLGIGLMAGVGGHWIPMTK